MKKLLGLLSLLVAVLLASCGGGGGFSGEQSPSNKLRMTPLLSSVVMPVGFYALPARVSLGVPPYYIGTTAPGVTARLLEDGTIRVDTYLPGKGEVWIQDSSVSQTKVSFAIESKADPLSTTVGDSITLSPGKSQSFTVFGGVPPYIAVSNNLSTATVVDNGNGTFTVTGGSKIGSADVVITDAIGSTMKVAVKNELGGAALTVLPSSLSGTVGSAANLVITGGTAPYTVISSNSSVVSAAVNGSIIAVGMSAVGSSVLIIQDSAGVSVTANITVAAAPPAPAPTPLFKVLPPTMSVNDGTAAAVTFTLTNGTAPFYASVPTGQSLITVPAGTFSGTSLTVNYTPGACLTATTSVPVTVTDANGATVTVSVVINHPTTLCP